MGEKKSLSQQISCGGVHQQLQPATVTDMGGSELQLDGKFGAILE